MTSKRIKWLVMDVDGTLTDGKIYMGSSGEAMKAFDVKDGYGVAVLLPKMGIESVVITGRTSEIVARRCEELGVKRLYQGVGDKLSVLMSLLEEAGLSLSEVAYMGDDLNDLECMQAVREAGGVVACPADAVAEIYECSDFVSSKPGGAGAVRETIEFLQSHR